MEELTPARAAVKRMADNMLRYKRPGSPLTYVDFHPKANAIEIERRLKSCSFGGLMLDHGDSLSMQPTDEQYPDLNLYAVPEQLKDVSLRVYGMGGADGSWLREIVIGLWYVNGDQVACQEVVIHVSSGGRGVALARDLLAIQYAETGYEGHEFRQRNIDEHATLEFLTIAAELFGLSPKPQDLHELN